MLELGGGWPLWLAKLPVSPVICLLASPPLTGITELVWFSDEFFVGVYDVHRLLMNTRPWLGGLSAPHLWKCPQQLNPNPTSGRLVLTFFSISPLSHERAALTFLFGIFSLLCNLSTLIFNETTIVVFLIKPYMHVGVHSLKPPLM